jgi:hypothetical protein
MEYDNEIQIAIRKVLDDTGLPDDAPIDECARERIRKLGDIVAMVARRLPRTEQQELLRRLDSHV